MSILGGGYADISKIAANVARHPFTAAKNYYTRGKEGGLGAALDPYSAQTARAAAPEGVYGTNRYYATPKADGGWDFFKDDMAISQIDWEKESGLNPPSTSDWNRVASASETESPSAIDSTLPNGNGPGTDLGTANFYNPYTGQIESYNLNDPQQRNAAYSSRLGILSRMRDEAIGKAKGKNDRNIRELDNEITKTYNEAKQYVQDYTKNVNEFGDQYQLGNVKRGQFFAGLSPNAYQSSQGTSQQFAEGKYNQGLADYATEALGNVGQNFMSNQDINQLDQNSIFGQNIGNIKQSQQDTVEAYNEFINSSNNQVGQQAADLKGQLGGINEFGFSSTAPNIRGAQKVDVSGYQPYTTFLQAGQQVPVGSGQTMAYSKPTFSQGSPLEAFLGQNVVSSKGKDYISAYLNR